MFQIGLPLWQRVIFVDWHGVLCHQPFWHSILSKQSHPVHAHLKAATEVLFKSQRERVRSWMRGDLTSSEIIDSLEVPLPHRYRREYLKQTLLRDCRSMNPNSDLLRVLRSYAYGCQGWLVLATDNMDCFAESLESITGLLNVFDCVLCSSQLGVLKSDGVARFFGPWLDAHGLGFHQAVLIDDSENTCLDFERAGGISINFRNMQQVQAEIAQGDRWEGRGQHLN